MSKGTKALATLIGRMGADVQVRSTQGGRKIGSTRVACSSGYGDNETTSWFDVVVFDEKKIEVLEKYAGKGSRIMIAGELRVRKWTDRDGADRYTTEVVISFEGSLELMDSKDDKSASGTRAFSSSSSKLKEQAPAFGGGSFDSDLDDDVPF